MSEASEKTIAFQVDILWVTAFMVQRANERYIASQENIQYHQFVLRPWGAVYKNGRSISGYEKVENEITTHFTDFGKNQDESVAEIQYNPDVSSEELLEKYEDAWIAEDKTTALPEATIFMLNELYPNITEEMAEEILTIYSERHSELWDNGQISITAEEQQADEFYAIAREINKDKEQEIFIENLNSSTSEYDYSVIDMRGLKEYPCSMGEHWETFTKIVHDNYREEFTELVAHNDVDLENKWITENFKFNSKSGSTNLFGSDIQLYNGMATGTYHVELSDDYDDNLLKLKEEQKEDD